MVEVDSDGKKTERNTRSTAKPANEIKTPDQNVNQKRCAVKIALLEPFMTGSHASWANGYAANSRHRVEIFSLEGKYWKWRMHGGAVSLARQFRARAFRPDMLLVTDMLDLTGFLALTRDLTANLPCALYFHENQLSYPWSPGDVDPALQRDAHYSFINYTSALAADRVCFNSTYHRRDFLTRLPGFLNSFPDHHELDLAEHIDAKSITLPLGLDLDALECAKPISARAMHVDSANDAIPLILWNHRWEYDKNPEEFFEALFALQELGIDFELAVLGEAYRQQPAIFATARERLQGRIVHWGYVESYAEYAAWLWRADILPVTSMHDFFGISVVEAIYCGCFPLLPLRLAYPEHVDPVRNPLCFYQDAADFVTALAQICESRAWLDFNLKTVRRYNWGEIVAQYDTTFAALVAR